MSKGGQIDVSQAKSGYDSFSLSAILAARALLKGESWVLREAFRVPYRG
jgi:hypothetical protein